MLSSLPGRHRGSLITRTGGRATHTECISLWLAVAASLSSSAHLRNHSGLTVKYYFLYFFFTCDFSPGSSCASDSSYDPTTSLFPEDLQAKSYIPLFRDRFSTLGSTLQDGRTHEPKKLSDPPNRTVFSSAVTICSEWCADNCRTASGLQTELIESEGHR